MAAENHLTQCAPGDRLCLGAFYQPGTPALVPGRCSDPHGGTAPAGAGAGQQLALGTAPPASSPAVGNEARGESPDLPALPPPEVGIAASVMLPRVPWHARTHTQKKRWKKPFWIGTFYSVFILNLYHLKNLISVAHWAHAGGGSLTAPVLAPVLIPANHPNAIVNHRSDSWHRDSCLLDMRGAPRNCFRTKNSFI